MKPRIVFLHGNQSLHWSFAWSPWLKSELEKRGYETFFETFPDSIIARKKYWIAFLKEHIKAGPEDVLVGWSSGAVAAMRYAEIETIRGSILISPCYTDLHDALEAQSGYYETPWDWERIRSNQDRISLIHSNNDPFIPTAEFEMIAAKLQTRTQIIQNAGHFIDRLNFPEILNEIETLYH
jgi:predicted alpha/beta hydrolase family esterase